MSAMADIAKFVPKESWDVDQWRSDEGGPTVTDYYLHAPTERDLDELFSDARRQGWQLPPGLHVAYEREVGENNTLYVRSYIVRDNVELDGSHVANAVASYDPNTNRPISLLDFDRQGAQTFAETTERIAGHKLATTLDGEVKSAPIVNG